MSKWIDKLMWTGTVNQIVKKITKPLFKSLFLLLSLFCSPRLHLLHQKNSKIVKYYYNIK